MGIKFSIVGRKRIYNFEHSSKFLTDLEKKHYRIEIGNQLGKSFIVFHAVLLKHDKGGYLIIGDS